MREAKLVQAGGQGLLVITDTSATASTSISNRLWAARPLKTRMTELVQALATRVWVRLHYVYPEPPRR